MNVMGLPEFLTVLVLGLVSAFVLHTLIGYRMLNGADGFLCKWIFGLLGGWIGPRVFGHWGLPVGGSLYFIPAVLGAFAGAFLFVAAFRALAMAVTAAPRQSAATPQATPAHLEMRKAS
jgi:uncharacterized membrane protein YeaQ/YmgE (transglycosylase-associated protein family)